MRCRTGNHLLRSDPNVQIYVDEIHQGSKKCDENNRVCVNSYKRYL